MKKIITYIYTFIIIMFCTYCGNGIYFKPIKGFSPDMNNIIKEFLIRHHGKKIRKVAVFDGDGTVLGQTPHYLADECMYEFAKKHPEKHPKVINRIKKQRNTSMPYVKGRVEFFSGSSLEDIRNLGADCFNRNYKNKIFQPMKELIAILKKNDFEVWIVTASPEALYQKFLSRGLDVPITNVVGVKSVVRHGIITDRIVHPVPQDEGKTEAIETFVQTKPLLVGGNSRGDKEMIEFSKDIKMIVNPDEHISPGQTMSIADYAKKKKWLIVKIRDVPEAGFPAISSKDFNVRLNKTRDVK